MIGAMTMSKMVLNLLNLTTLTGSAAGPMHFSRIGQQSYPIEANLKG